MKMVKKRGLFLALLLVFSVLFTSLIGAAGKSATTVEIISFNDFHGNVAEEVNGKNVGMAKLMTALKETVAKNPNTIIVAAGDLYQGTAISNLTYGAPVSEMLKAVRITASAVGNHEFDWGADRIQEWAEAGNFPFLAANIYEEKTGKLVIVF